MNKVEIGIGLTAIAIGLALMMSGQRMCSTSCWIDDVFKWLLPKDYEFLAGGMPSLLVGIAIVAYAIWKRPKP
ncbi:hypothetical protein [Comamonas testosteroni]|uniref:hypothetical protein n=1 Tax=Comamonas testosteroni TaxID=285 RepID=UPI00391D567D